MPIMFPRGSVGWMMQQAQAAQAAAQPTPVAPPPVAAPNPNVVRTTTSFRPSPAAVAGLRRGFRF